MGKVFNEQIVKILCVKNLQKDKNEIVESNNSSRYSILKRGESYVVFLNKENRKKLQRQIVGLEQHFRISADTALCAVRTLPNIHELTLNCWMEQAISPQNELQRELQQQLILPPVSVKERLIDGLSLIVDLMKQPFKNQHNKLVLAKREDKACQERVLITPAIFGPFPDEPFCAAVDHCVYCICLFFGRDLKSIEISEYWSN